MLGAAIPLPNAPVVDNEPWIGLLVLGIVALVRIVYTSIVSRMARQPMPKVQPITRRSQERKAA